MKVGIFGRHPIPQPGFMGVMSLFEAIHLSRRGHEVDLVLPFADLNALDAFLRTHALRSLDDLPRFHGDFGVVPSFAGADLGVAYDVGIWQSYDPADRPLHFPALRRQARILTKNFPKFVPGARLALHETVASSFQEFDLVACALEEDVQELRTNRAFWHRHGHQVAYVPRGAEPGMLHPARKLGGPPTIGLEVPLTPEAQEAIRFWIEPIRRLQVELPGLRVLTLGERPHPAIRSEHIPYGRFDQVYEQFFNEIWLYLIMDYRHSPAHVAAPVQRLHPADWSGRAIYEVQNVEAQMSGAVVIGHPRNLITELLELGASAFHVRDDGDEGQITTLLRRVIDNYPLLGLQARRWALSRFTWEHCMGLWEEAMLRALAA